MCDKKSSSTSNQKTNNTSSTELTQWSRDQMAAGQDRIRGVVAGYNNRVYQPYTGEMVAGLSPEEQRARELATANVGQNLGLFSDAEDMIRTGANTNVTATNVDGPLAVTATEVGGPTEVNYRTFDADRVRERYNPYEQDVVNAVGTFMDEDLERNINDNQLRAASSGAYGGSRHGVADAEMRRTSTNDKTARMAELRYRGYNDAVAGDERETQGIFGADTFNSTGDYNARRDNAVRGDAANLRNSEVDYAARRDNAVRGDAAQVSNRDNRYNAAGRLTDLANQRTGEAAAEISMLERLGATSREIEQARLLAERAQYDEAAAEQWKRLQLELQTEIGLFGATPLLTTTTQSGTSSGTSTSRVSDPLGSIAGIAGGIGGLFSGIGALGG